MAIKTVTIDNFPEYMVCYAYYGDASGVQAEDIEAFERWREQEKLLSLIGIASEDGQFCSHPAFGRACSCVAAVFEVE